MRGSEPCELHDAAVAGGSEMAEALLRLEHSPIGDECQRCSVCRLARTYIERTLAERAGRAHPPDQGSEQAWRQLQAALSGIRSTVRRTV